MPKQDFLMRMIEQLQGIMPYVLDLVRAGNYAEAHAVIDQAVQELVGIGTDGLVRLPDEALLDRLKVDQSFAWEDKALFLATVLFEEAQILQTEGDDEKAYGRAIKSLNLLLLLMLDGRYPDADTQIIPDIDQLLAFLDTYHLPPKTCYYLVQYYEAQGHFGEAEDVLFDWLETDAELLKPDDPNAVEAGLAFYGRLQNLTDAELEAGGLSREEVATAVAELSEF